MSRKVHLKKTFVDPKRYKITIIKRNETKRTKLKLTISFTRITVSTVGILSLILASEFSACVVHRNWTTVNVMHRHNFHLNASKLSCSQCCLSFSLAPFNRITSILSLFSVVECTINCLFIARIFFQFVNKKIGFSARWSSFRTRTARTVHECTHFCTMYMQHIPWPKFHIILTKYSVKLGWNFRTLTAHETRTQNLEFHTGDGRYSLQFSNFQSHVRVVSTFYTFHWSNGHENLFVICVWSKLLWVSRQKFSFTEKCKESKENSIALDENFGQHDVVMLPVCMWHPK